MTTSGVFANVLAWLHRGYPEGVPRSDYFPLLALLQRSLTEEQVVQAAQSVLISSDDATVTAEGVRAAIAKVSTEEPTAEEIRQVAARLASVGWPLASDLS